MVLSDSQPEIVDKRVAKAISTRERILKTATRLFLEEGYTTTSLERVAEVAEVTKPTVYSHFSSKKGLLDAVVETNSERRAETLREVLRVTDDPRADLIRFGDMFMQRVFSRESRCWDRLAASEALTNPEVGEAFYRAGPARVLAGLTEYLRAQTSDGRLRVQEPKVAAEVLLGMLLGLDLLRTQIGQPKPSEAKCKRRCRAAVDMFLDTYQD